MQGSGRGSARENAPPPLRRRGRRQREVLAHPVERVIPRRGRIRGREVEIIGTPFGQALRAVVTTPGAWEAA